MFSVANRIYSPSRERMNKTSPQHFDDIREGAAVVARSDVIGTVRGFVTRGEARTDFVVALSGSGDEVLVPVKLCDRDRSKPDELWLLQDETVENTDADSITVPLAEERLVATVREQDRGIVRIHKRVQSETVNDVVDVRRDSVLIEHRQMDQPAGAVVPPWYEGETLVVPVFEEIIVTEKRLILREHIRITKQSNIEQVRVEDTVRRDVLEFEKIDGDNPRVGKT